MITYALRNWKLWDVCRHLLITISHHKRLKATTTPVIFQSQLCGLTNIIAWLLRTESISNYLNHYTDTYLHIVAIYWEHFSYLHMALIQLYPWVAQRGSLRVMCCNICVLCDVMWYHRLIASYTPHRNICFIHTILYDVMICNSASEQNITFVPVSYSHVRKGLHV